MPSRKEKQCFLIPLENMKRYTLLRTFMLFMPVLIHCGWVSAHAQSAMLKGVKALGQTVYFEPDTTSVLKNPLTGWVMYLGRAWDENFWQTHHYDAMPVNGGDSTVRVSDYAGTCYIRINWNMLESKEGDYVWNDPDSRIYKLLASVRERGMRLAFRINVDSRDQGQNTPLYVKEAGAKGFQDPNNPKYGRLILTMLCFNRNTKSSFKPLLLLLTIPIK